MQILVIHWKQSEIEKTAHDDQFNYFVSSVKLLLRNRIFYCSQFWLFYYCETRETLIISNSLIFRYKKGLVRWKLPEWKNPLIAVSNTNRSSFGKNTKKSLFKVPWNARGNKIESFRLCCFVLWRWNVT